MESTDIATEIITEMISQLPFGQAVQRTTIRNIPGDVMPKIADLVETKNRELYQELDNTAIQMLRDAAYHDDGDMNARDWLDAVNAVEQQRDVVERRDEIRELLMDLSREQ